MTGRKMLTVASVLFATLLTPALTLGLLNNGTEEEIALFQADPGNRWNDTETKEADITFSPEILEFRLAKDVIPFHYDLYLCPDLTEGNFSGTVSIDVALTAERHFIIMHVKSLNITSTTMKTASGRAVPISSTEGDSELQKLKINLKNRVEAGNYTLSLRFHGEMVGYMGLYKSSFNNIKGNLSTIAATMFEPDWARSVFPCFDEPEFKAKFSIKLVRPSGNGFTALSNMNVQSSLDDQPSPGLTTVTFATTVPMSTYLLCFVVSDYIAVTAEAKVLNNRTIPVSIYTREGQQEKANFALNIGVKAVEYFSNLFNIDYPLPKLDIVALPLLRPFAMENWGLVTFREEKLLFDKSTTSTESKYDIVLITCHEFAHMWFGNLVTMKWWNDLWLNEGFAAYMQYRSSEAILPEWGMMDHFVIHRMHLAMSMDSVIWERPIVYAVNNPRDISGIFGTLTYYKGAAILRMMENFIGSKNFITGVSTYVNKYAFRNAETADFLSSIQDVIGNTLNVSAIINTWIKESGYPVVHVSRNGTQLTLKQERFLSYPPYRKTTAKSTYRSNWTIPITYITNLNATSTLVWFDGNAESLTINLTDSVEWIKFNKDQIGYYRVKYSDTDWKALSNVLLTNHTIFSTTDRANLLNDAFSMAESGLLDYSAVKDITAYLTNETHHVPWTAAYEYLKSPFRTPYSFKKYMKGIWDIVYRKVTWTEVENEDQNISCLRPIILKLACGYGSDECLEIARNIYTERINNSSYIRLHPDLEPLVRNYGWVPRTFRQPD